MIKNESSNLAFNAFKRVHYNEHQSDVMTVNGTLNKTLVLLILVFGAGYLGWTGFVPLPIMVIFFGTMISSLIIAIVLAFKPMLAKYLAPVYSLLEGLFLGTISVLFEASYPGIVIQAILITFVIAFLMNFLYRTRIIKVTEKFRSILMMCVFGIFGVYMVSMIMNMFGSGIPLIHESGLIGIGFSLIVLTIASLTLLLDFDFIERQSNKHMPQDLEWYGAFALIVSLVWIYVEVLRLLAKLKSRN